MNIKDQLEIQNFSNTLFKEALRLTKNDPNYARDLVQEVWCKILKHDDMELEKLKKGYFIKVLRNIYYDQIKTKNYVIQFSEGIELPDESETEGKMITKIEGDEIDNLLNAICNYLDRHDYGWILKKQMEGYKLNELAKAEGIDYNNLRKIKSRLLSEIRQKFKKKGNKLYHLL